MATASADDDEENADDSEGENRNRKRESGLKPLSEENQKPTAATAFAFNMR